MSDLSVDGFKSSEIIEAIHAFLSTANETERQSQIKKTNGIIEFRISNAEKKEAVWTLDLKKTGKVTKGPAKPKADVTLLMTDDVFQQLADGKLNGQKAFMSGKLKTKGNMMLATKLDGVLKAAKATAKL
ncbi:SCP2 sterol-binding domain-containing protein [Pterulicium gracile]|uniref:SCP2 sterol-binding domain-containing protein n=1 Tax=Pterulicium gracile TaxID=1884261 RepID=A0A5C3QT28_9AGAR|nr:SCP2 sterol-binding domain-containing protein [Pterula gracilis]